MLHTPVFVTGVERSGSTIVARILGLCGVFTGEVTEMQENKSIRALMDYFYERNHLDPRGQYPLPECAELNIPHGWALMIEEALSEGRYNRDRLWMYKSSRLAQTWPVWHYAFPNARWIIVRRRSADIIQSCIKTAFMDAFKNEENQLKVEAHSEFEGWVWWIRQHERMFVDMITAGVNCKVIWPERMVTGDYQQVYEMLEWLGLRWHDGIVNLVSPLLMKQHEKERSTV